jgi:hypothetical protein
MYGAQKKLSQLDLTKKADVRFIPEKYLRLNQKSPAFKIERHRMTSPKLIFVKKSHEN